MLKNVLVSALCAFLLVFGSAMAQATAGHTADCPKVECPPYPVRPSAPAKVVTVTTDVVTLPPMHPGERLTLNPKVRMSYGPLSRDLTATSSNPAVAAVEYDKEGGRLVISAFKPGKADVVLTPDKDTGKVTKLPVEVVPTPTGACPVVATTECGSVSLLGLPWWLWLLLLALVAALAYYFGKRRADQEAQNKNYNDGLTEGQRRSAAEIEEANRRRNAAVQALNNSEAELLRTQAREAAVVAAAVEEKEKENSSLRGRLEVMSGQLEELGSMVAEVAANAQKQSDLAARMQGVLSRKPAETK